MKFVLIVAYCLIAASFSQALTADDVPVSASSDDIAPVREPEPRSNTTTPASSLNSTVSSETPVINSTAVSNVTLLDPTTPGQDMPVPDSNRTELFNDAPARNLSLIQEVVDALANLTADSRFLAMAIELTASTSNNATTPDAAQINAEVCGRRSRKESSLLRRFVSGTRSNQKDWGWMVLLQGEEGVITGTLINSQWVLTRARGIDTLQTAVVGAPVHMQTRKIAIAVPHMDYDPVTKANDIGLIKLDKPVVYSEFTVPICLPEPEQVDYLGVDGTVTSFVVSNGEVDSEELRKSEKRLAVLNDERCTAKLNKGEIHLNATVQICSVHQSKDALNEVQPVDLGAALTIKQDDEKTYAIGVASSAWVWSKTYNYIIYTRVSSYIPWILKVIQDQ